MKDGGITQKIAKLAITIPVTDQNFPHPCF